MSNKLFQIVPRGNRKCEGSVWECAWWVAGALKGPMWLEGSGGDDGEEKW